MVSENKNRVLNRINARELTPHEAAVVTGGQVHTNVCTIGSNGQPDGDVHPCP
jgi:hypothetical protein